MTTDVILREVVPADLPVFFEHQRDPAANLMAAFAPRDWPAFLAHWEKMTQDPTVINRTIVFEGRVVGNVGSWEQGGERLVCYWIGREYWGRGLASSALAALLDVVKTRPLHAYVAKHNPASLRVLKKCGFEIDDVARLPAEYPGDLIEEFILKLN